MASTNNSLPQNDHGDKVPRDDAVDDTMSLQGLWRNWTHIKTMS
jgi:hypothetical protein